MYRIQSICFANAIIPNKTIDIVVQVEVSTSEVSVVNNRKFV